MKIVSILSISSLALTAAFVGGLALNFAVQPLFAAAAVTLLLLNWAGDYRVRKDYAACTAIALRPCQALPLAA
jgi:hypothetical protein